MLYEVERHEPLTSAAWDALSARACIEAIVRDAVDRYSPDQLWPPHPKEDLPPEGRGNLYAGAAGVIAALDYLAGKAGSIRLPELAPVIPALLELNRGWLGEEMVKDNALAACGLLTGDTGILLVQARLGGLENVADRIGRMVNANRDNPVRDLMWGSAGTMLASLQVYEWTGEGIWADRFRRDAQIQWERLELVPAAGCHLWMQHLYGFDAFHVGAVHGFAGNAFPIVRGWRLLTQAEQDRWAERLARSLRQTAMWEDDCANWPQSVVKHRPGRTAMLVQHCHGAPGILNSFAQHPDPGVDDLLLAAGEMTWRAGPLRKGPGLCHGTAGNGYAFLKLFRRTGDARWLDRARRFAMHAIEQQVRDAKAYGRNRYTLWTGDLGLAIYLWNCINTTDWFPSLDGFFEG